MEKTEEMPLWVYLAYSSIESRKTALLLTWTCLLISVYCIPWALYFSDSAWISSYLLIDDYSWVATMLPVTFWYWLSLRWIDKNSGWAGQEAN